jgi:hypothetical protein
VSLCDRDRRPVRHPGSSLTALTAFERLFQERGSPSAPTTAPFASPNGLFNLFKLSVWWLGLGIKESRRRHLARQLHA